MFYEKDLAAILQIFLFITLSFCTEPDGFLYKSCLWLLSQKKIHRGIFSELSKKGLYCPYKPTILPTFQSGTEKPFKMTSLISYIVRNRRQAEIGVRGIVPSGHCFPQNLNMLKGLREKWQLICQFLHSPFSCIKR